MAREFDMDATIRSITSLEEMEAFVSGLKARGFPIDSATQSRIALRKIEIRQLAKPPR